MDSCFLLSSLKICKGICILPVHFTMSWPFKAPLTTTLLLDIVILSCGNVLTKLGLTNE